MESSFCNSVFTSIVTHSFAQEWLKEKSGLYYIGSEGKVYLAPDYSAHAVYFKDDVMSKKVGAELKQQFSRDKSSSGIKVDVMDLKGMIRIKSALPSKSPISVEERQKLLKSYNLYDDGAYEVLPAFTDRGVQVFLTKRISISLKDGYNYEDFTEIFEKYGAKYQRKSLDGSFDVFNIEKIENQLLLVQELNEMGVLNWGGVLILKVKSRNMQILFTNISGI